MADVVEDESVKQGVRPRRAGVERQRRHAGLAKLEARWAVIFILPCLAGLAVFYIWPIFQTLYFSFTTWGAFGGHEWTGLTNYLTLFTDEELVQSLVNTAIFSAVALLAIPIAIVVAALLNRPNLRGLTVYRTIYFIPIITLPAAVGMVWRYIYNGDYGPLNQLLRLVGIQGPYWISDPRTAIFAMAVVAVWSEIGYNVVLLMAGMQAVPKALYEAASIDGAGPVRQFFAVTLPLLTPTIFFVLVIGVIHALQTFDLVFMMIGDPSNPAFARTQTIVYLFYQQAFVQHNGGYASAIVFLLLAIVIVLTAIQFAVQKKWVTYD